MRSEYDLLDERVNGFWHQAFKAAADEKIFLKDLNLPLARIKRLMKVEEGVRMVASEVPVLFSMITEKFIEELTLRAWINTEENKRRILQKSDLTAAVKTSEMFDFLVYIVPRNDLSRPFNHLVPNKMHHGDGFGPGMGDVYVDQHAFDEREAIGDPEKRPAPSYRSFYPEEHLMKAEPSKPLGDSMHMDDYRGGLDISLGRDMPADIAPEPFS